MRRSKRDVRSRSELPLLEPFSNYLRAALTFYSPQRPLAADNVIEGGEFVSYGPRASRSKATLRPADRSHLLFGLLPSSCERL
jgi:hypothetical protein